MRARCRACHRARPHRVRGRRHRLHHQRRLLFRDLRRRHMQPRALRGRGRGLRAPRGLLLVSLPAGWHRAARLRLAKRLRQRRFGLWSRRRVLQPGLRQRGVRERGLRASRWHLYHRQRLLLGRVHGRQMSGAAWRTAAAWRAAAAWHAADWLLRSWRAMRGRWRLLRRSLRRRRRGREGLPAARRLPHRRRDL